MPFGHVILALYAPETNAIAALTTSIDNNAGGATYADWSPTPEAAPRTSGGRLRQLCRGEAYFKAYALGGEWRGEQGEWRE